MIITTSAKGDFVPGGHAGIGFLKNKPADKINKVFLQNGIQTGFISQVYGLVKKKHLIVQEVPRNKLDKLMPGANHQGLILAISSFKYANLDRLARRIADRKNPFLSMLGSVEDPHSLGSILRSADATGVDGIIIPKRRVSGLTSIVAKTSTGAIDHVLTYRANNLVQTTKELKKVGYWLFGTAMEGQDYYYWDAKGKCVLVIGNEGKGISPLLLKQMGQALTIPMVGHVQSLDVSVAAGALLYQTLNSKMFLSR